MNVIQTLFLVFLLLGFVAFVVLFSARIFAAAIAQESINQTSKWDERDKVNNEKIKRAMDAAAGARGIV